MGAVVEIWLESLISISTMQWDSRIVHCHPQCTFISQGLCPHIFQFGFPHPDLVEYPEPESSPILPGLSLTMKLLLFSLLAFAIILVIFSASVGAICRIQCRVVDTGDQVLEQTKIVKNKDRA